MIVVSDIQAAQQYLRDQHSIALVPTMGNLHAGHLSLVNAAKQRANKVVVSIFVNPAQFGPQEDFASYPRTFEADCKALEAAGVDLVFAPEIETMYPEGKDEHTVVKVPKISEGLCTTKRPHFLQGVTTIVCQLFHIIKPNLAIFGEKDYQQLRCIQKMVKDLHMPIEVVGLPTVREPDGLAMSSRNQYLSAEARAKAPLLYQSLQKLCQDLNWHNREVLEAQTTAYLNEQGFVTDYIQVRTQQDLAIPTHENHLVVLAAVYLGGTRLIDNIPFVLT